mgnify:CR=1 FL=1|tara:strand:+ start:335 stop:763 length:429 start_codon:yes stop_codon:yes gene_type:complete
MNIIKELLFLIIAFCVGIFFLTYLLNLPGLVTGKQKIVDEYYKTNFITNVPLDLFFILLYFLVAYCVMILLKVKNDGGKLLTVAVVTALLTGFFCYYFTSKKMTTSFFSRWFNTVGYSSIIYDVILLVFIYAIYLFMKDYVN